MTQADDTGVIITNSNATDFQKDIIEVSEQLTKCFNFKLASQNSDKANLILKLEISAV
jgi:hypothetical protein